MVCSEVFPIRFSPKFLPAPRQNGRRSCHVAFLFLKKINGNAFVTNTLYFIEQEYLKILFVSFTDNYNVIYE